MEVEVEADRLETHTHGEELEEDDVDDRDNSPPTSAGASLDWYNDSRLTGRTAGGNEE